MRTTTIHLGCEQAPLLTGTGILKRRPYGGGRDTVRAGRGDLLALVNPMTIDAVGS